MPSGYLKISQGGIPPGRKQVSNPDTPGLCKQVRAEPYPDGPENRTITVLRCHFEFIRQPEFSSDTCEALNQGINFGMTEPDHAPLSITIHHSESDRLYCHI